MISLSKTGNAIKFTFTDNGHYLQNGTIEVPVNSLTLVTDDSDMFTFKKSATNDIFVSGLYSEIGMTKAELETYYKNNMVGSTGGGGGGDITSGEVQTMIDESISGKADTSAVTESINEAVSGKVDESAFTAYSGAVDARLTEDEKVTSAALNVLNANKLDASAYTPTDLSEYWTSAQTDSAITAAVSGKVDTSTYNTYTAATDAALSGKQDTLSAGTNITISGNVISAEGGGKAIEAGRGISVTTGETADTISFNLALSGGGNSNLSVVGGRNCTASNNYSFVFGDELEQKGGSSSVLFGSNCKSKGSFTFAGGWLTEAQKEGSFAYGHSIFTKNKYEHSVGQFNNSVSASTTFGDSGNTLFSVGNGTANDAKHNAFEIRQNGDIYITSGGTDIKLQDNIPVTTSAVTSGSAAVVTSGGVYDQLGGMKIVKLTESEYTALVTKDSNTLYVVIPDPSN